MFFCCWRRLSCALLCSPFALALCHCLCSHSPYASAPAAFLATKRVQSPRQQQPHSRKASLERIRNVLRGPKMVCILLLLPCPVAAVVAVVVCLHTWPRVAAAWGVLTKTNSRQACCPFPSLSHSI